MGGKTYEQRGRRRGPYRRARHLRGLFRSLRWDCGYSPALIARWADVPLSTFYRLCPASSRPGVPS